MTKIRIGLLPWASIACVLALSCGSSSDVGGAGSGGAGGASDSSRGGTSGSGNPAQEEGGVPSGPIIRGNAGAGGDAAGAPDLTNDGGQAGSGGPPLDAAGDTSPLQPSAIKNLAFWLDGNATSYSDLDENYPTPKDSGRVRSIPEMSPLTGSWQAASSAERPIREVGALNLRPCESVNGYSLKDTAGTLQTNNSTLAISFRPLNSNSSQGGLTARVGMSFQNMGIYFIGDSVGLYFNHTQMGLRRRLSRGVHVTMIVRFTPAGIDVQYDVNGIRTFEQVVATIAREDASNFLLGYNSTLNASMYGFVSQVVGVDRAISDAETGRLMTWLTAQPIPEAFPVSKPLVAIVGDSIANGDQIPGWQSWAFSMLNDLTQTHPDVQLLNDASNGTGIPTVKNSTYSDRVLPWYSASRTKNILIVAAGANDIASGAPVSDVMDRYYGLLDSARATGWKTIASTILPRSDAGMIAGVAAYEAARNTFNAELVKHYADHADALADVAAIPHLGAVGDSDNAIYYSPDKIHPIAAGHALLEPVYSTAVAGLL